MKKTVKLNLVSLLLISTSAFAANPVPGWYGGLILGVSYASNISFPFIDPTSFTPQVGTLEYDVLGNIGGQIGYRVEHFRFEGEILYNNSPYDKLTYGDTVIRSPKTSTGLRLKGYTNIIAGMFNAYYDIYALNSAGNTPDFVPFVGVGIGYASVQNDLRFYNNEVLVQGTRIKESSAETAGQAIVGINYFLDDFTVVGLDYRYFTTQKISDLADQRIRFNSINLTVSGAFDSIKLG